MSKDVDPPPDWRAWLGIGLVCILGLGLRLWFMAAGTVENALRRSDTLDYLQYALNLFLYHCFSKSHVAEGPIVPDSFRDPGYPAFLAGLLSILGFTEKWYVAVLVSQAVLGALTAGLTVLIARRWLSPAPSLAAGFLVAIWPHNVVFSGYVLSETLFGFLLTLAVWLTCRALESASRKGWFVAGLGFGFAAMVNAVLVPVAPLLALVLWKRRLLTRTLALALLLGAAILPGAWAVRGWSIASEHSPEGRAIVNLVQGSWPGYHDAYIGALEHNPSAQGIMQAIGREQDLVLHSPAAGAASIWERFRADPRRYLAWYAWKPALLWAWSIRMGWGDIYAYPVVHSIYLSNPVMPAVEAICFALNPLVFLLMTVAALATLLQPKLARDRPALFVIAMLIGFETLIYSLLQSEPRYSIPFRPLEMILAATALEGMLRLWRSRFPGAGHPKSRGPASAPQPPDSKAMAPGDAN